MGLPRRRFTLRIAIALVALSAATTGIVAVVRDLRDSAARERCQANLRNLALAVQGHALAGRDYSVQGNPKGNGAFPPGTLPGGPLPPEQRVSWVPLILPWADWCQNWHFFFDTNRPWYASENCLPRIHSYDPSSPETIEAATAPPQLPGYILCPTNRSKVPPGMPHSLPYVGIAGLGYDAPSLPSGHLRAGVFGYDRQTRIADITDGASETMMLAETTSANGPWTAGGPATVRGIDLKHQPYIGRGRQFGGAHRGGTPVAFADGSVRFIREAIDPSIFEAIATIAGREALRDGWDR